MNQTSSRFWSPYLVGSAIGILSTVTIYFMNNTLGTSSTFVHLVGWLELLLAPEHANASSYFQKILQGKPFIDWQFALVIGLFFGALTSSKLYKSYQHDLVPSLWQRSFGPSFLKRSVGAFIGGFFVLYGARLAGGCTSGKAISSGLQLGVSAWLFIIALFITGIVTAHIMYSKSN